MQLKGRKVAIVGMGGIFPNCTDLADFNQKLFSNQSLIREWDQALSHGKKVRSTVSGYITEEEAFIDLKQNYKNYKKTGLNEAEYKGKDVQLNKPKRGGSKKFYVYVMDPKTKRVKKVSFGAAGGGQNLAVKIRDPKARKAFAARQNCDQKKDKTKPGYWSCNIGRYWKSLGGGSNFSGYW